MAREPLAPDAPQELVDFCEQPGRPECLAFEHGPSRDLMWCHILNEPAILEFTGGNPREPICKNCGGFDVDRHTFIARVLKPRT